MGSHYAILGGGVLGLTTGLRLLQAGDRVTIFEREPIPGGLAAGFPVIDDAAAAGAERDGVWLDKFYHHIFRSDHDIIRLIEEVGLKDQLLWRRPLTVTLRGGRPYQLDSVSSLLRFTPIPVFARLRMGFGLGLLRALPSPALLEGRKAAPWVREVMGTASYEAVWGPLLTGKFGDVAGEIGLPWFWARVHDRSAELGYVRGGFQRFYNRLAEMIRTAGGTLQFATTVKAVEVGEATHHIVYEDVAGAQGTQRQEFDRIVSTLPTRLTARLIPELPEAYRARYDWGRAYGAHCLILALDRPLTKSYWMNVNDPGYPFMVLVEHTNYMPASDYGGQHLVYLGNYKPMNDALFTLDQHEVLRQYLPHLARINPTFEASWVQRAWMFSAPFAQPIVTTDYREHIPPFDTPLPGVFVANMFQVYPHDRGQNYSVRLAEQLVSHVRARN